MFYSNDLNSFCTGVGHKVPSTLDQNPLETNQYGATKTNHKWSYGGPTGKEFNHDSAM